MRRVLPLKIALASFLVAACVTINVYFPAAAADKVSYPPTVETLLRLARELEALDADSN